MQDEIIEGSESNSKSAETRSQRLRFQGVGEEYFRIWLSNSLLSICTLGIYSAWAKVRRLKYFYGNIIFANANFQYLADPLVILRGRIIAFAFVAIYMFVEAYMPGMLLVLILLFMFCVPWLVVRAMVFKTRNSSYRNIRFNFQASTQESYKINAIIFLINIFSLGLAYPYSKALYMQFILSNISFGKNKFQFIAKIKEFFKTYAINMLLLLATFFLLLGAIMSIGGILGVADVFSSDAAMSQADGSRDSASIIEAMLFMGFVVFAYLLILIPFFLSYTYLEYKLYFLQFNSLTYPGVQFKSDIDFMKLLKLKLKTTLLTIITLGLYRPYAVIRVAKYKAESITITYTKDALKVFADNSERNINSTGEEVGDMFDIDVGL